MQPINRAALADAPLPPAPPANTIAAAMANKAPPPPTMRGVAKPLPPVVEEPEGVEPEGVAIQEPEATEGAVPQDMNRLFNNLMKAS